MGTLNGIDDIQRDLKSWAHVKLNKAKCKVLERGQGNPKH